MTFRFAVALLLASIAATARADVLVMRNGDTREGELRSALDEGLSGRQQARLVFFEERLHRVMQRRLREAAGRGMEGRPDRGRRPGAGRRPEGPGAPQPGEAPLPEDDGDPDEGDL